MYTNNLKLGLLKINQIKLMLETFLRFRIVVFHVLACLWNYWLDLNSIVALHYVFKYRWDLVAKTCGFGIQYITVWNQVILQLYFSACLFVDLWELKFPDRSLPAKDYLKKILPFCFTTFVFPVTFVVFFNFWTYYSIQKEMIDEDNVMAQYIPEWVNHGLHTIIVLLVFIEKVLVQHPYPSRFWTFFGVSSFIVSYSATCTFLYIWSGVWPYPLIKEMTSTGRLFLLLFNCLVGIFFVVVGEALNNNFWGIKASKAVTRREAIKKTKTVKVS